MTQEPSEPNLFVVAPTPADESLLVAVERSLARRASALDRLPTLTNIALGDSYLAEQLSKFHEQWELRPGPARGLLARLRTRMVWWLLGPEIQQINATHATLLRLIDSLIVQLDWRRVKDEG
jgi:hypothetical protein